jgi:hypothetical protein
MNSLNPKLALPLYKKIRCQCKFWRSESQHFTEPAAALWMGVISQAIFDLCNLKLSSKPVLTHGEKEKLSAAKDALDFLVTSAPRRLKLIAQLLGLNQQWVTQQVSRVLVRSVAPMVTRREGDR